MKKYSYDISTNEIVPPLGNNNYSAKIAHMYVSIDGDIGEKEVFPELGESWGKTKEEARSKMDGKAKAWIAENQ